MSCKSVCVPVPAHVISDWRQQGMLCLTGESLCPRLLQMGWKMIKISMMPGPISQFLMEPGGTNYSAAGLGKKIPPPWNITAQLSAFMAAQNFSWYQLFSFGKDKVLESTALFCCCNFLKKFPLLPERIASHEYACMCRLWASQESRVASTGILPAGCPRSCQCLPVQPPSGSQHKLVACLVELIWKNTPKHSALPKKINFNTVTNVFLPSTTKFTERKVDKKEQNAGRFSIWRAGVRAALIDCWDFFITSEIMLSLWDVVE